MNKALLLYKQVTDVAKRDELGEGATKFSISLNQAYTGMLEEFAKRSNLPRAHAARLLLCSALDDIDLYYNLRNDVDFDSSDIAMEIAEFEHDFQEMLIQDRLEEMKKEADYLAHQKMMKEKGQAEGEK